MCVAVVAACKARARPRQRRARSTRRPLPAPRNSATAAAPSATVRFTLQSQHLHACCDVVLLSCAAAGPDGSACSACNAGFAKSSTGSGACVQCAAGSWSLAASASCLPCPGEACSCLLATTDLCVADCYATAGSYGSSAGLQTASCSGLCDPGSFCVQGSTSSTQAPCPGALGPCLCVLMLAVCVYPCFVPCLSPRLILGVAFACCSGSFRRDGGAAQQLVLGRLLCRLLLCVLCFPLCFPPLPS